jgi:DNA-directed RNA polymerase subunit RPC12/RpoP
LPEGVPAVNVIRKVVATVFRGMLQRLSESMRRFMYGRCGVDQLNIFLLIASVALSVVAMIFSRLGAVFSVIGMLISFLSYGLLFWYLFRFLSRNLEKRILENRRYLTWKSRILDRENRYYRCPNCKQTVRVPKGRGKIRIKCPKCSEVFIRKS